MTVSSPGCSSCPGLNSFMLTTMYWLLYVPAYTKDRVVCQSISSCSCSRRGAQLAASPVGVLVCCAGVWCPNERQPTARTRAAGCTLVTQLESRTQCLVHHDPRPACIQQTEALHHTRVVLRHPVRPFRPVLGQPVGHQHALPAQRGLRYHLAVQGLVKDVVAGLCHHQTGVQDVEIVHA